MKASERMRVYEWIFAHKDKAGAQYPKILNANELDYRTIRRRIRQIGAPADYELLPSDNRAVRKIRVFIQSTPNP